MRLGAALILGVVIAGIHAVVDPLKGWYPRGQTCNLHYEDVIKFNKWECAESQYQEYPVGIEELLNLEVNYDYKTHMDITTNCQDYVDKTYPGGYTTYGHHTFQSLCQSVRTPVKVVWVDVMQIMPPGYILPDTLKQINNGLLPVHVLPTQKLYKLDCYHPWYKDFPERFSRGRKRRFMYEIKRMGGWGEISRHLCFGVYGLNKSRVCKPVGLIDREVVVHSTHLQRFFIVTIRDVPTSCSCTQCKCSKKYG